MEKKLVRGKFGSLHSFTHWFGMYAAYEPDRSIGCVVPSDDRPRVDGHLSPPTADRDPGDRWARCRCVARRARPAQVVSDKGDYRERGRQGV